MAAARASASAARAPGPIPPGSAADRPSAPASAGARRATRQVRPGGRQRRIRDLAGEQPSSARSDRQSGPRRRRPFSHWRRVSDSLSVSDSVTRLFLRPLEPQPPPARQPPVPPGCVAPRCESGPAGSRWCASRRPGSGRSPPGPSRPRSSRWQSPPARGRFRPDPPQGGPGLGRGGVPRRGPRCLSASSPSRVRCSRRRRPSRIRFRHRLVVIRYSQVDGWLCPPELAHGPDHPDEHLLLRVLRLQVVAQQACAPGAAPAARTIGTGPPVPRGRWPGSLPTGSVYRRIQAFRRFQCRPSAAAIWWWCSSCGWSGSCRWAGR